MMIGLLRGAGIWIAAAAVMIALPWVFTSGFAMTVMSQIPALIAALFIGILDNMAISYDISFYPLFAAFGVERDVGGALRDIVHLTTAGIAPVLPYLLLVLVLIARPRGLFGVRDV